jgi:hypothetical protein
VLRGTKVRIKKETMPIHLIGQEGFVIERFKNKALGILLDKDSKYGFPFLCGYNEKDIEILEPPVEL